MALFGLAFAASLPAVNQALPWQLRKGSTIMGSNVKNPQGQSLGNIQDLVISPQDSRIAYAVLSLGGILGLGEKLFAVPFNALQRAADVDTFILDMPQERLKNAPQFNQNNWPQMTDPQWIATVYQFYGLQSYWESQGEVLMATVENTAGALQLKMAEGQIVEFAVPETILQKLQAGDRLEIILRKTPDVSQQQSGRQ
jgi:sporulation protein YlmC with PRC-barrel domain